MWGRGVLVCARADSPLHAFISRQRFRPVLFLGWRLLPAAVGLVAIRSLLTLIATSTKPATPSLLSASSVSAVTLTAESTGVIVSPPEGERQRAARVNRISEQTRY